MLTQMFSQRRHSARNDFVLCRARNRSPGIGVDRIGETPLSDLTRLLDLLHSAFDTVEPQKLTAVHGVAQVDPSPDAWK